VSSTSFDYGRHCMQQGRSVFSFSCFFSLSLLGYVSFLLFFLLFFLCYDNVCASNNKSSSICRARERNERKTYILDYYHHYTKDSYSHTHTYALLSSFFCCLFISSVFCPLYIRFEKKESYFYIYYAYFVLNECKISV
jgi:magnesium-transporting ATPase (P-type)